MAGNIKVTEGGGEIDWWHNVRNEEITRIGTPTYNSLELYTDATFDGIDNTTRGPQNVKVWVKMLQECGFSATLNFEHREATDAGPGKVKSVGYICKHPYSSFLFIVANCKVNPDGSAQSTAASYIATLSLSNGATILSSSTLSSNATHLEYFKTENSVWSREVRPTASYPFTPIMITISTEVGVYGGYCTHLSTTSTSTVKWYSDYLYTGYYANTDDATIRTLYDNTTIYQSGGETILIKSMCYAYRGTYDKIVIPKMIDLHTYRCYCSILEKIPPGEFIQVESEIFYVLSCNHNGNYGQCLDLIKI